MPADQRQDEDPRLELAGQVPDLADLAASQRSPGGEREDRPVAELGARRAGLSISRRNGPCSGGRFAATGPASRTRPVAGRSSTVRSSIVMTAIGVPSGSASKIRSGAASAGWTLSGTSSVIGTGNGVPSASRQLSARR